MIRDLLSVVVPVRCVACSKSGNELCSDCRTKILQLPKPHDAAFVDSGVAGAIVRRGKSSGVRRAAAVMAALASSRHEFPAGLTTISWVPSDPIRGDQRGYHLPSLFAHALARELQVDSVELLQRGRRSAQRGQTRAHRLTNALGLYRLVADFESIMLSQPDRPTILLVDDVRTTGATLSSAAQVLEDTGMSVSTFTFVAVPMHGRKEFPRNLRHVRKRPTAGQPQQIQQIADKVSSD